MTEPNCETDGQPTRPHHKEPPPPPPPITTGPDHYAEAIRYAEDATSRFKAGEIARAQALAAIGQIHATLAAASAAVLQDQPGRLTLPRTGTMAGPARPAGSLQVPGPRDAAGRPGGIRWTSRPRRQACRRSPQNSRVKPALISLMAGG